MSESLPPKVTVRRAAPQDEKRWRELFDGYCLFYKRPLSEPLTRHTAQRAAGVGEQLIGWLVAEMKREGWSRLYWHTRLNNYRARGLYDKFTPHSDFVRYTVYPEA